MKKILTTSLLSLLVIVPAFSQQYPVNYNSYLAPTNPNGYYSTQLQQGQVATGQYQQNYSVSQQSSQATTTQSTQSSKPLTEKDYKIRGKNGIDLGFSIGRKFTDFVFELTPEAGDEHGSILEWDDMIFNEYTFTASKTFKVSDAPLFVFGEYKSGQLAKSGKSNDNDLRVYPYYWISVGGIDAETSGWKLGVGWDKWFKSSGFQISPVIGYSSQSHNLTMKDHQYPIPQDVFLYVEDTESQVQLFNSDGTPSCLTTSGTTLQGLDPNNLVTNTYFFYDEYGILQDASTISGADWKVGMNYWTDNGCVISGDIGWDLTGPSQIYDVTWQGMFVGLMVDRYMSPKDSIHFYGEFSFMDYEGDASWPARAVPTRFVDAGNGYGMILNMAYRHKITVSTAFEIKAEYENFWLDEADTTMYVEGYDTEVFSNAMKSAVWHSMGLHLGIKTVF